jgi:cytochrome P450
MFFDDLFFLFGCFVSFCVVLVVFCFLGRREGSNGCPGVTEYPLIGSMMSAWQIRKNLQAYSMILVERHKYKTLCITNPWRRVYVTSTPADVQVVLSDVDRFIKGQRFRNVFRDLLGDGIFNADHELWASQRKAASHLFAAARLREFQQHVFVRDAEHLVSLLEQKLGETIDLQNLLYALTFDSFCTLAFGESLLALQATADHAENAKPPFLSAFDQAVTLTLTRFALPEPVVMFARKHAIGNEAELKKHLDVIDETVFPIVDKVLALSSDELESRKDLLGLYAQYARKANDRDMLDRQFLRDVVINFLLAGRDTTASTLTSLYRLLCHFPDEQARIDAEVDRTRGSPITFDLLKSCEFTDACVHEALRLFPPVLSNTKVYVGKEPFKLPSGPTLVEGDILSWKIGGVQRNPQFWHRANEFVPQRWIEKNGAKDAMFAQAAELHQSFFPAFNGGRRLCLGKSMALIEAKTIVCALSRSRVRFELVDKSDDLADWHAVTPTAVIALQKGLRVRVLARR